MSFVTHLESTFDGTALPGDRPATIHGGKPLLVRYDLAAIGRSVDRDRILTRPAGMWRWRELSPLPEGQSPVSLGECETPLLDCPSLARHFGVARLTIKDESRLPTASFKARGMAMAVSMAKHFGTRRVAVPTAGNAGGALAAYAARAGIECFVFMPKDTPVVNQIEVLGHGAHAFLVDGLIHDCARLIREHQAEAEWFDMSTLREPYRIEGKKTMGLELATQLGMRLPDAILYPTGGGTGLIGMQKGFEELRELGWLDEPRMPRWIACQSDGCAPIARAFEAGLDHGVEIQNAHTVASGLRVPKALGDFLILRDVRKSGGAALAVADELLVDAAQLAMRTEGIALCPESAACLAAIPAARACGALLAGDHVVLINTGSAWKYVEAFAQEPVAYSPRALRAALAQ